MMIDTAWAQQVKEYVQSIPRGRVASYGLVAHELGRPRAARSVGAIMRKNYDTGIPCHRVIKNDGTVGEYNRGGSAAKIEILREEGVCFDKRGRVKEVYRL